MTTLVSFLGKGQDSRGYRNANYQFDDGEIVQAQKYIGTALANKFKPTKIIFLGTSGSMWDVFLETASEELEDRWLSIVEAVQTQSVSKEMLSPFERFLSQSYGVEVHCVLIPFAKNTQEQIEILSVLSNCLQDKEQVVLDVTHGFRHLPMLALVVARYLKKIKQIDVKNIYYGALEMTENGYTPVLNLDGMLSMLDWVDAIGTYDKDGDYSVFAPLLINEGLSENDSNLLKEASFFERNNNSSQANQKLSSIFSKIEGIKTPIFDLFKPQLVQRLNWFKKGNRGKQEQRLAYEYLARKDYLRAVIFAQEGMISAKTFDEKGKVNDYTDRENSRNLLKESDEFRFLSNIRNSLVHGLGKDAKKDLKRILSQESTMKQSLDSRFNNLFCKIKND